MWSRPVIHCNSYLSHYLLHVLQTKQGVIFGIAASLLLIENYVSSQKEEAKRLKLEVNNLPNVATCGTTRRLVVLCENVLSLFAGYNEPIRTHATITGATS
jgi:hypothetical protein